uniref:Heat-shock protein 90 n=1 Tax=Eimeria stiedai TaxID=471275 RepID=A0A8K1P999_9EIME|nr:heat-shock protein 90 [Eimeria stiedai]
MREVQAMMAATQAVRSHPRLQKYSQEDPEYLQKLISLIGQIQANPSSLRLIMAQPVSLFPAVLLNLSDSSDHLRYIVHNDLWSEWTKSIEWASHSSFLAVPHAACSASLHHP